MTEPLSQRRMAQNEVVFRNANRQIQVGIDNINAIAKEENEPGLRFNPETLLQFICECSDENCTKRMTLKLREYNKAREISPKCFVVIKGHEVPEIEEVIATGKNYCLVLKHELPPENADTLMKTDIDNTSASK